MDGKSYTVEEATRLLEKFCLYRDRNHQEVEQKLNHLGMIPLAKEQILTYLIAEGYLNEGRYAESFARGKAHINKWGKNKIVHALKSKGVSAYNLRKAIASIEEEIYLKNLEQLVVLKWAQTTAANKFLKKQKVIQYLLQKGYSYDEVKEAFEKLALNHD